MKQLVAKREEVYKAVWREPIYKLCKKYNILESKLKYICKYLDVPIPDRKYWIQFNAGKNPEIKELPNCREEREYREYISEETKKETKEEYLEEYRKEVIEKIIKECNSINLEEKVERINPLVMKRKSTINDPKNKLRVYEVKESKEIKKRIDLIYHYIISTIEKLGYKVEERYQGYSAIIEGEEISFRIREKGKIEYREPNENDYSYMIRYVNGEKKVKETIGTGNLELKIDYYMTKEVWKDTDEIKIEDEIGNIIIEIFYCAKKKQERRKEQEKEKLRYKEAERKKQEKEILFRPAELKMLYEIGKKISKIEVKVFPSKMRIWIVEDIIEKIILHIGSFIKVIKETIVKELDIAILASIARNIMECSNAYFYYAERKITDEEIKLRHEIAILHYSNNMRDILKKLKYPQSNERNNMLDFEKKLIVRSIKESKIYKKAQKNERTEMLSGNKAYISKRQKEIHKILDKDTESAIYNIFSNSTHSYYIGLGNNSMNLSFAHGGYIDSKMLLSLSTEISIIYVANVLVDYLALRRKMNGYLTEKERQYIKEMTSTDKLFQWLEMKKEEYGKDPFDDGIEIENQIEEIHIV